jgi:hypothetical protein
MIAIDSRTENKKFKIETPVDASAPGFIRTIRAAIIEAPQLNIARTKNNPAHTGMGCLGKG